MTPGQIATVSGRIALAGTVLLMLLVVFLNVTGPAFNLVLLVIQLAPLGLTLHGLTRGTARSYQWLCFVILFFLTQGILLAFTPGSLFIGLLETAVCLLVFFSAIIFIRTPTLSAPRRRAANPHEPDHTPHG